MTGNPEGALLDGSSLLLLIILGLAIFGFWRGIQSEGITLAGLLAAGVIFTGDAFRGRLVVLINKLPKLVDMLLGPDDTAVAMSGNVSALSTGGSALIRSADQRLLFYVVAFVGAAALFYLAGSILGGRPASMIHRIAGLLAGALGGLVVTQVITNFSQDYLLRHPEVGHVSFRLPQLFAPTLPATHPLAPYTTLIFVGAVSAFGLIAVFSIVRAKR